MSVRVSFERARGCGRRKEGGLYLVAGRPTEPCPLLPRETSVCPCCGQGIKPARGWTWVDPSMLVPAVDHGSEMHVLACPFGPDARAESKHKMGERAGLIWVGEKFYATPAEFMREAHDMGISRRITAVPRDFVLGETWVLLGHRKAIPAGYKLKDDVTYETLVALTEAHPDVEQADVEEAFKPGIITAFMPTAIEYVTRPGDREDEEFLASLEKRGIEPVEVRPVYEEEEVLPV